MVQINTKTSGDITTPCFETNDQTNVEISQSWIATSGIYSDNDLDTLRDHIMFPAERLSVLNTVARGMMGQPGSINGAHSSIFWTKLQSKK